MKGKCNMLCKRVSVGTPPSSHIRRRFRAQRVLTFLLCVPFPFARKQHQQAAGTLPPGSPGPRWGGRGGRWRVRRCVRRRLRLRGSRGHRARPPRRARGPAGREGDRVGDGGSGRGRGGRGRRVHPCHQGSRRAQPQPSERFDGFELVEGARLVLGGEDSSGCEGLVAG